MTRIAVSRVSRHPIAVLWPAIADLESHPSWMKDAKWLVFVGDQRHGVGTHMKVRTAVGPFRTTDDMMVTGWEPERYIDVEHVGVVKGVGRLSLEETKAGVIVRWEEELTFPWWAGGAITAWLARPFLGRIWSKNLERLDLVVSDP